MSLRSGLPGGERRALRIRRGVAMMLAVGVAMLGSVATATSASAHTNSHEATCSTVSVILAQYDASTTGTAAIDEWYSWTGGQGENHPFPSSDWQLDHGNHNGLADTVNLPFEVPHGDSSSWFYHKVVSGTLAKVNHVKVWINGSLEADQDFSVSYSGTFNFPDKYATTNTYRVAVTKSVDGIGIFDTGTIEVAPCQRPARTASMNLTYMTSCAPDVTNTWRIRNGSDFSVPYTLEYYGQGVVASGIAAPGDSLVNLPRMTATAILKWGGGDSNIIAGQKTKASGIDEQCPIAPIEVTPELPTRHAPTCDVPGSITFPATEPVGYSWSENLAQVSDEAIYKATADKGYVLAGEGVVDGVLTVVFKGLDKLTGTPCLVPPPPVVLTTVAAPAFTPGTCLAVGSVVAPDTSAYAWSVSGPVTARLYQALPKSGFTLTGTTAWTFDLSQLPADSAVCVVAPPVVVPPAVAPTVLAVVKNAPVKAPVVAGVAKSAPVRSLAFTGADPVPLSLLALLALLLGAALTVAGRRQGGQGARG